MSRFPVLTLRFARRDARVLIRSLQRETGITTLVITHDQAEAVALSDKIALLLDGRITQHAFHRRVDVTPHPARWRTSSVG